MRGRAGDRVTGLFSVVGCGHRSDASGELLALPSGHRLRSVDTTGARCSANAAGTVQ